MPDEKTNDDRVKRRGSVDQLIGAVEAFTADGEPVPGDLVEKDDADGETDR